MENAACRVLALTHPDAISRNTTTNLNVAACRC